MSLNELLKTAGLLCCLTSLPAPRTLACCRWSHSSQSCCKPPLHCIPCHRADFCCPVSKAETQGNNKGVGSDWHVQAHFGQLQSKIIKAPNNWSRQYSELQIGPFKTSGILHILLCFIFLSSSISYHSLCQDISISGGTTVTKPSSIRCFSFQ